MAKREPKLLRMSAAPPELGLHPITVRRWIKGGRIQAGKFACRVSRSSTCWARSLGDYWSSPAESAGMDTRRTWISNSNGCKPGRQRRGQETLALADIGSGLKAGRRQLQRLLELVCEDKVGKVAISYEDRVTRFGQKYVETLF
jgi:putative resolvase